MKISIALIFGALVGLFCVSVSAQVKEISAEEYYRSGRSAIPTSGPVERTRTTLHQRYADGALSFESETVEETDGKGSIRITTRKKTGGKENVSINVFIGNTSYSKKDDGEWTTSSGGGFASGSIVGDAGGDGGESKYTVEEVVDGPFKTKVYTLMTHFTSDDHSVVITDKRFIGNIGWLLKTEYQMVRDGVVQEVSTSTFEYSDGKIKIDVPIK